MRIYLAGPMRGYPRFNFDAFNAAAEFLRGMGYDVFSPAERDVQNGFNPDSDVAKPLSHYMAIDLPEVCKADALVLLKGWEASEGANIEVFNALAMKKHVWLFPHLEPLIPYPPAVAFWTCQEIMKAGALKHKPDSWYRESPYNHFLKAQRHLCTHMGAQGGFMPADGEDHSKNALCRTAMLVAQRQPLPKGA